MGLPILTALITVPIYITHIGLARYGVLSIIWVFLGYFGFLDFGLSRAAANALARLSHGTKDRIQVLMTSLYLNLLLGVFGGIILYFVGVPILRNTLTLSGDIAQELESAFPWLVCLFPLSLVVGVARGAVESREHFLALNVLDVTDRIVSQILPVTCAVLIGPSLAIVIPAVFVARAATVGITLGYVALTERPGIFIFDRSRIRELFSFGAWVTVTNLISPILMSIDQMLVGSTLGTVAVAHYSVPMSLMTRSQTIAAALVRALFPRFSRLGHGEAVDLAERSVVSLAYGFGAICGPAIIVGGPFIAWWISAEFAKEAAPVFELLMIGAWINGIAFIPFSFLQGQRRPGLVAKLHLLEFLPFIFALWVLLQRFGLLGAALAWSGRVAIDAVLLFSFSKILSANLLRLVPALALLLASYVITQTTDFALLLKILIAGVIFLMFCGCAVIFDPTSRDILLRFSRRLISAVAK